MEQKRPITISDRSTQIGIYEKGLPTGPLPSMLNAAARAGYDFVEMSIDESPGRLDRLGMDMASRRDLLAAGRHAGCPIRSITVSAQRAWSMGDVDPETRSRSLDILVDAIRLAADIEAPVVQVAGYATFERERSENSYSWFIEGLNKAAVVARSCGVQLGVENVDGEDVITAADALRVVADVDDPAVKLYPDIGNLAANDLDVVAELLRLAPIAVGFHLKDTRVGVYRRVPFGAGIVPWEEVFDVLSASTAPLVIEMWNDRGDPEEARRAREWLGAHLPVAQ